MTRPVGSQTELEARRRLAVALLRLGHSVSEVAQVVDVWPSSVYRWKDAYEAGGDAGLTSKPVKGGPSTKLSDEQLVALAALLEEGPQAHGFDTDLWTLKRIAVVIDQEFGVSVGQTTVWRYLQKMGWSCQKPERRAIKRDANAVRRWKQETIPTLEKKKARVNDLALVFLDESTVRMQSTVRRTWAPRGNTPIHRNSGSWQSIRAIAALTVAPKTGATALDYWLSEKSIDSEKMAFLLRDLFNQQGQDCILIWDNYPAHKPTARMMTTPGWPMAPKVAIDIQFLPTYAPDFNPVEQVWKSVKYDDLANYVPTDRAALKARLDQSLRAVQDRPELLRSFVRWAGFDLDESHYK